MVVGVYRRSKRQLEAEEKGVFLLSKEKLKESHSYIVKIDYAKSCLDPNSRLIIEHELNDDDPNWFYDYYSLSTYNRHRAIAYKRFVEALMF